MTTWNELWNKKDDEFSIFKSPTGIIILVILGFFIIRMIR